MISIYIRSTHNETKVIMMDRSNVRYAICKKLTRTIMLIKSITTEKGS